MICDVSWKFDHFYFPTLVRCDLSRAVFHRALCSGPSSLSRTLKMSSSSLTHTTTFCTTSSPTTSNCSLASAPAAEAHEAKKAVEQCVAAIKNWCASRRLKLNDGKTEVGGLAPALVFYLAGVDLNLSVGSDIIRPSTVVRDLGVFVDAELTFREHVRCVTSSCFFQLRRLRQIRKHVNRQVMKQLVHAFVISRLDYCNSILAGLPKGLISQLHTTGPEFCCQTCIRASVT